MCHFGGRSHWSLILTHMCAFKSGVVKYIKRLLWLKNHFERERFLCSWISSHGYINALAVRMPDSLQEHEGQ